jgi:hypothetical protein
VPGCSILTSNLALVFALSFAWFWHCRLHGFGIVVRTVYSLDWWSSSCKISSSYVPYAFNFLTDQLVSSHCYLRSHRSTAMPRKLL